MQQGTVPATFRKGPWYHERVERANDLAIYRRWKLYDGREGAVHYEVVRLQIRAAHLDPQGHLVPAHEAYPPSSTWGSRGWTFKTLSEAQAKYTSLLDSASARAAD
jgi:hypothetical protein